MAGFCGEPALDEVLSDPIIHALMKADGTDVSQTCDILLKARRGLRPALVSRRVPMRRLQAAEV
jgi:hypothetical protein